MRRALTFVGIAIVILGVIILVLLLSFPHVISGVQLLYVPNSSIDLSKTNTLPQPFSLDDSLVTPEHSQTIVAEGLRIDMPWNIIEESKLPSSTFVKSENQNILIVQSEHMMGLAESLGEFDQINQSTFSDYDAMRMILEITADDLSLFDTRDEAELEQLLIINKLGLIPESEHVIYAVDTEIFKGYIFYVTPEHNKNSDTSSHRMILFHEDGEAYELFVNNASHEEIAYILSSIKK